MKWGCRTNHVALWPAPDVIEKRSDIASQIVKGWMLSGTVTAESGRAYATGLSIRSIPFTNTDGTLWNGNGGVLGQGGINILPTVARNNSIGRPNYRLDLRLGRDSKIGERFTTQIIAEGFKHLQPHQLGQRQHHGLHRHCSAHKRSE